MTLQETKLYAEDVARRLPARVYALSGELGAGKTAFSQFFLRALGVTGTITSPTFVVMKPYSLDPALARGHRVAYHMDCYRLSDPRELEALGFAAIVADPANVVIVEWAEKIRDLIPAGAVWIDFSHGAEEGDRAISVRGASIS